MSYSLESLLITGGAGFIGSNLVIHLVKNYPHYKIINLDKLTYAGTLENLKDVQENYRHVFIQGDICDTDLVNRLFIEHNIKGVIHLAAESHVDNSIHNPTAFVQTNVLGTLSLLNAAKAYWMEKPHLYKQPYQDCRFHHVSTDEVYGELGLEGSFKETDPYAPNSPYSASKAGSDFLVRSYGHTFGLNTVITNCSNNYGPRQHDEKLIPTIIRKALTRQPIPIYGKGQNIRDWLYVEDHIEAILAVYHQGKKGECYNIGSNCEKKNLELAYEICALLDKLKPLKEKSYYDFITFVEDRHGHDFRYAVNVEKIFNDLGWKALGNFEKNLEKTIQFYIEKYSSPNSKGKS